MIAFIEYMFVQYLLLSVTDPAARFKPVGVSDVSIYVFITTSLIEVSVEYLKGATNEVYPEIF